MELNGGGVARGGEGVKGRFVFDFVFINNLKKKITTHQLVAIEILLDLIAFFVHGTSFFLFFF